MQIHVVTKCMEDHPQKAEFRTAIAGTGRRLELASAIERTRS
jgi:hypothetical protein